MVYGIRLVVNGTAIEDEVNDLRVTKSVVAEDSISIGSACASEAVFSLDSPSISLDNEEITIQIGKDEIWTNLGVYKVCSTSIDRDKYTYTCYDAMTYKLQEPFNAPLEIPITDVAMLGLISTQSGLTVDGLSEMVPTNCYSTLQDTTMRQALSYVAGLQGKNAIINANGHIELKWFTETEYTLTDDTIYMDGITISNEEAFYIDTLRNITTDGEILEETDSEEEKSYRRILTENPLIVSDNIRSILDKIKTITPFKPISVRYYGDFDVNVGDIITVITNGVSYAMPVMEISYDIDGGVVCEAVSKAYSKEEAQIEDNSPKVTKEISTANKIARLTVDADKINFLISYNEQTSQFEITPEGASLITNNLDINAIVNFINDSGDTTKINGGKINTSDLVVTNGAIIGKFNIKDNMLIAQGSKADDTQIAIEYEDYDGGKQRIITGIKPNGATTEVYALEPGGIEEFDTSTSYGVYRIVRQVGNNEYNILLPYEKSGTLALTSDLSYQKGNTVSIRGNYGGHLTGANKQIIFSINIPKTIDSGVTTATLKANVTVRCNGAYLLNNASVTLSATLDASARQCGNIVFTYNSASALGGTNNSAADIWVAGGGTITFS